jgi:NhaP-type Na+/H+ or K+/H+ antiporter
LLGIVSIMGKTALVLGVGVIFAALLFYGLFARVLNRWWLSAALVLTGLAVAFGDFGLHLIDMKVSETVLREVATAALATVLFTEAAVINTRIAREVMAIPTRLLAIGLPLTIAAGTLLAKGFFSTMAFSSALVLGTILAPTDAALGRPVVTNEAVPEKLRSALSIESGLNDGLAVPVLLIAIALETGESAAPLRLALKVIGIGLLVGVVMGAILAVVVSWLRRRDDLDPDWFGVLPALAAIVIYVVADELGGSGFVAAFVGGIAYGVVRKRQRAVTEREIVPSIDLSMIFDGATWFMFGLLPVTLLLHAAPSAQIWLYALLSLTLVRMIPVALSLIGTKAKWPAVAFTGWFGPRGLASVVFIIVFLDAGTPAGSRSVVVQAATLTVTLSVIAHGLSATPLAARFGSWAKQNPGVASLS